FEEDARLDQPRDRLKAKTANGFDARAHLAELRDALTGQCEPARGCQVFGAGVGRVRGFERRAYGAPELVLFGCVRRIGHARAGAIVERDVRDLVAPRAIGRIAETRMIWIEFDDL